MFDYSYYIMEIETIILDVSYFCHSFALQCITYFMKYELVVSGLVP